ncbi:MBL fold metallo-hydrolase [candidate division KSB1 bacterium]|nr:MBL fold metallo-hydrolase [candidate division KSB1 bacterium]
MDLSITFLGTGGSSGVPEIGCTCPVCISSNEYNRRTRTSICIHFRGKNIVVDTTPEFRLQLLKNGIDNLDALIFTHHHADHIMGLTDIRPLNSKQKRPIAAYGSQATLGKIRKIFYFIFDVPEHLQQYYPQVDLRLMNDTTDICGLTFHPFTVFHGRMPVTAFRFGKTAYITDVNHIPEEHFKLLEDLDLLILEAFRHEPHISHYSLDEAIAIASKIGAKQTLFTHISHDLDHDKVSNDLPESVSLAYDGLKVNLSL